MNTIRATEAQVRALSADEIDAVGGGNVIVDAAGVISKIPAAIGIAVSTLALGFFMGVRPDCY